MQTSIAIVGKFGPRNEKCQFQLKFSICTNPNMQKLKAMFTFSDLDQKYSFLASFVPKSKFSLQV